MRGHRGLPRYEVGRSVGVADLCAGVVEAVQDLDAHANTCRSRGSGRDPGRGTHGLPVGPATSFTRPDRPARPGRTAHHRDAGY